MNEILCRLGIVGGMIFLGIGGVAFIILIVLLVITCIKMVVDLFV